MSVGFAIGFSIVALILAMVALGLGVWGIIEVMSFKRSTHNIQYVPLDAQNADINEVDGSDEAYRKLMEKANAEFMQPPMQDEVL